MHRRIAWVGALALGIAFLVSAPSAHGFIKAEDFSLKKAIEAVPFIFVAKVSELDAEKKKAVLVVGDTFQSKQKPPFERLPIYFGKPSDEGAEEGHVAKMLKRLASDL